MLMCDIRIGTGDCDGAVNGADGKPIKVPCSCPPSQDVYIQQLAANVAAGHAVHKYVFVATQVIAKTDY